MTISTTKATRGGGSEFANTRQVAEITGISERQLIELRMRQPDESPPFLRVGARVLYPLGESGLQGWAAQRVANRGAFL